MVHGRVESAQAKKLKVKLFVKAGKVGQLLTCQDRLGWSVTYLSGQVRLVSYLLVKTGYAGQLLTVRSG